MKNTTKSKFFAKKVNDRLNYVEAENHRLICLIDEIQDEDYYFFALNYWNETFPFYEKTAEGIMKYIVFLNNDINFKNIKSGIEKIDKFIKKFGEATDGKNFSLTLKNKIGKDEYNSYKMQALKSLLIREAKMKKEFFQDEDDYTEAVWKSRFEVMNTTMDAISDLLNRLTNQKAKNVIVDFLKTYFYYVKEENETGDKSETVFHLLDTRRFLHSIDNMNFFIKEFNDDYTEDWHLQKVNEINNENGGK